jgi:hypothetical protein
MKLATSEFLRRFLLHVIPKNFVRIRAYGLLSNRTKGSILTQCRLLLGSGPDDKKIDEQQEQSSQELPSSHDELSSFLCPKCRQGHMITVGIIEPDSSCIEPFILDSS